MRLVFQDNPGAWVVIFEKQPVAIGGTIFFISRADAVTEIAKRSLVVLDDGTIQRPDEVNKNPDPVKTSDPPDDQPVMPSPYGPEDSSTQVNNSVDTSRDRGRPPTYSPEEAKERRLEQNRRYYHDRDSSRADEVTQRSREWWASHPDRVRLYRAKANEKRRQRYLSDPEYKERVARANRLYQERRRAAQDTETPTLPATE